MSKNIKIGNKIFTDVEYISCKGAEQDGVQRKYVDVDSVPETQEKLVTITESGTSEVTPDEGKVLSKVTVIAEINTVDNEHYTGETTINPSADSDTVLPTANKIVDSDITVKKIGKPFIDSSKLTDLSGFFQQGRNNPDILIENIDTSNVTNMSNMFNGCTQLTTVPLFDTSNVGDMGNMFKGCAKLTEVWIKNIKVNLQVGSGTSWGHLLTVDSLVHLCQELVNVGSSRTLTVGSANLTKLASVYVKLTVPEAEDTTGKLPCEVCESTDEGAMLIEDYIALKHWQLA